MGDGLHTKRAPLLSLWQELALNFYPQRADFTTQRSEGEEFATELFTSYPCIALRELANLFAANLRPSANEWFSLHVQDEALDNGVAERRYLEYMTDVQRRAMYDSAAGFIRATKEADHDFASFGQAAIQPTLNLQGNGLLFLTHHLRDCAWSENAERRIDVMHRNKVATARQLKAKFGDKVSKDVNLAMEKEPEKEFKCRHIVVPQRVYDYRTKGGRRPEFVSLYVECESETTLEEVPQNRFGYVVPRWLTVSGSQYARSPATDVALPDSRTMQAVIRTIREAGEKFVDPPLIATREAIRSDIDVRAGGLTWVDMEYDEKLGEVLRPLTQDKGGMPVGFEIAAMIKEDIRAAFFLDKIQLPDVDPGKMTAFEVRRRIEEHIRAASPLFEPIEKEYNAPLCEEAFLLLMENGAFGPPDSMPETLRGAEVQFTFQSPLREVADQGKAAMFAEGLQTVLMPAMQLDPAQMENVDLTEAVRDSLRGQQWPATWFKDKQAVAARRDQMAKQANIERGAAAADMAAEVAGKAGTGIKALQDAGVSI